MGLAQFIGTNNNVLKWLVNNAWLRGFICWSTGGCVESNLSEKLWVMPDDGVNCTKLHMHKKLMWLYWSSILLKILPYLYTNTKPSEMNTQDLIWEQFSFTGPLVWNSQLKMACKLCDVSLCIMDNILQRYMYVTEQVRTNDNN